MSKLFNREEKPSFKFSKMSKEGIKKLIHLGHLVMKKKNDQKNMKLLT